MNFLFIKIMFLMSFICSTYTHATETTTAVSELELRNGSSKSATFRVFFNIPGIDKGIQMPIDPICITLDPSKDGTQAKYKCPISERYGLVSIEIDGACNFYQVVDLRSVISVGLKYNIYFDINPSQLTTEEDLPEWLFKSLTFKRFDLTTYVRTLKTNWSKFKNTSLDSQDIARILDLPSCLHGVGRFPEISTPFPYCLNTRMKEAAVTKYIKSHPEIVVSEEEIRNAEKELKTAGLPIYMHE